MQANPTSVRDQAAGEFSQDDEHVELVLHRGSTLPALADAALTLALSSATSLAENIDDLGAADDATAPAAVRAIAEQTQRRLEFAFHLRDAAARSDASCAVSLPRGAAVQLLREARDSEADMAAPGGPESVPHSLASLGCASLLDELRAVEDAA